MSARDMLANRGFVAPQWEELAAGLRPPRISLEFRVNGVTSEAQGNGLVCVGAWRGSEYATRM